jgi:hypothetical protein
MNWCVAGADPRRETNIEFDTEHSEFFLHAYCDVSRLEADYGSLPLT